MRRPALWLAALGIFGTAGPADAADVALAGRSLSLKAPAGEPDRRSLKLKSDRSDAVAAPLPDPAAGASLVLFSSNADGQCRAEIPLPAQYWAGKKGDGASRGWVYKDKSGSASGVRSVQLKPGRKGGRLVVKAKGALPCALEAALALPLHVVLRVGGERYCTSFGGDVRKNEPGRFKARKAPALACPDDDVTAATLNILHGLFCPVETGFCRLEDRVDLLGEWIAARGCPSVVALQEIFANVVAEVTDLVETRLTEVCPVPYEVVFLEWNRLDDSLLLTRHRALEAEIVTLHQEFRHVLWARLDHPLGPLDVLSTHLASGADNATAPCDMFRPCPPECLAAGAVTIRDCQAEQTALAHEARSNGALPALIMGDMNEEPGSFVYTRFTGRGWLDSTAAVGNPECEPLTGDGCTSGREGEALDDLESPVLGVDRRIDYLFVAPPDPGSDCAGTLDGPDDDDGDGVATRLFAEEPNPFSPTCGPAPDPVCFVSDHNGAQVDLNCGG